MSAMLPRPARERPRRIRQWLLVFGLWGLSLGGCGKPENPTEKFVPSGDTARSALLSALDGWRDQHDPKPLESGQTVLVADTQRRPGQTLVSYRIVGEAPLQDGRRFVVRLQLADPDQEERAQFLIIGLDPLWVFRQEDYDMIAHWDHPMPDESAVIEQPLSNEPPAPETGPSAAE